MKISYKVYSGSKIILQDTVTLETMEIYFRNMGRDAFSIHKTVYCVNGEKRTYEAGMLYKELLNDLESFIKRKVLEEKLGMV
jgi:hypothetical protein